jgi:predicted phosphodiesterase
MHGFPLDDEIILDTIRVLEKHEGNRRQAAREIGIDPHTLRDRLKTAAKRGLLGTKPVLEGFEITEIKSGPRGESVTQKPAADEKPFDVGAGRIIGKITHAVRGGNVEREWIRTSPDQDAYIAAIKASFDRYEGRAEIVPPPAHVYDDWLTVYPIADQHNGLLAWGRETGSAYDLKIGCERLRDSLSSLVYQAPPSKRAIILNLGDWQHTNDQRNMTPRSGNVLDVDSRYFKILTTGVQLQQDCVDMALAKHESVEVVNIRGNHDPEASDGLTVAMAAFYSRNPRVKVCDDPKFRSFWVRRFGASMIAACHGDKMKPPDMAMNMATRYAADWGQVKFRYCFFGHIHHETKKEVGGVICESFRTLAGKDAFSFDHFNSGQSLVALNFHVDRGQKNRIIEEIDPVILRAAA